MRAFVFSGGASHGSIQVGMAMALAERGIEPDLIVGTSVGAINGAWLAGGRSAADLATVWNGMRRQDLFPTRPMLGLKAFLGKSSHFVPNTAITTAIDAGATDVWVLSTGYSCDLIVPPPCPVTISPIDFSHSSALIERALQCPLSWLDAGEPHALAVPTVRTAT